MIAFGCTKQEAFDLLSDWNDNCDPPWSDDQLWHKIEDAIAKNPAPIPDRPRQASAPAATSPVESSSSAVTPADGDEWTSIKTDQGRTDRANSRRFLAAYGDRVRFVHPWGKWLVWDGSRWELDDSGAVMRLAMAIADQVWMDAKQHLTRDVADFAVATSGHSRLSAMLKLAAADSAVSPTELDAHPWLLNCANGTVDLRTGELRPYRREDLLTRLCPTKFDPDAPSYDWDRFLEGVFVAQELIDFCQRLSGYCLTGDVSEQILAILWGSGSNGKSVFVGSIQGAVGPDYCTAAPPGLLMEKKGDSHPTELAGLFGRRIVIASETSQGARLAESTVKQLTGGDRITARRMREDFWEFDPTHKILMATNHRPRVRGTDHAIWRRLVLVPFTRTFWNPDKGESGPEELRQDKTIPEKLRANAEGILAWMVRGCLEWQRGGLRIPESVRDATAEYRSASDTVGRFLGDCCLVNESVRVKFSDLYGALESWCQECGDTLPTRRFVGEWLTEHGFKNRHSGGRWYLGLALKAD
jgi:putative DNA primase/helicase